MANTNMNVFEALEVLNAAPVDSLAEWVYESHKDFYGVKGHHMTNWTKGEYLDWIQSHFMWDCDTQCWANSVPFID